MSICQIEEREAGRSYPRTCPTCRLGPCSRGHDYKSMREQITTQAAEIERLTRERERLALAICGGEDAPGYASAQTVETLEGVARDARGWRNYDMDRATEAEAAKDRALALYNHQSEARVAVTAERDEALARATAAEAEAERLREALKDYACDCPKQCWDCKAAKGVDWVDKGWTARAALTERKP